MKICAIGHQTDIQQKLLTQFQSQGDEIIFEDSEPLPPADVYFCTTITQPVQRMTHGLIILDLRPRIQSSVAKKAIYADICLVDKKTDRTILIKEYRCEPARVFVITEEHHVLEIIEQGLRGTLLPSPPLPEMMEKTLFPVEPLTPDLTIAQIRGRLQSIERQADVMLRDYRIHSGVPVIGKLIAWLRRNLTSHLREPYLDPMFNRQVAFNTQIARELQTLLSMQTDLLHRIEKLEQTIFPENNEHE